MTNKPMLSVERELLERLLRVGLNAVGVGCKTPEEELRALLDKPVAQHQGEPVAWVVFDNGFIDDHTVVKTVADEWEDRGLEVTPLYAERPAPVAVVMPARKPQRITDEYARGWNDYDAEYKRLNGVKL